MKRRLAFCRVLRLRHGGDVLRMFRSKRAIIPILTNHNAPEQSRLDERSYAAAAIGSARSLVFCCWIRTCANFRDFRAILIFHNILLPGTRVIFGF